MRMQKRLLSLLATLALCGVFLFTPTTLALSSKNAYVTQLTINFGSAPGQSYLDLRYNDGDRYRHVAGHIFWNGYVCDFTVKLSTSWYYTAVPSTLSKIIWDIDQANYYHWADTNGDGYPDTEILANCDWRFHALNYWTEGFEKIFYEYSKNSVDKTYTQTTGVYGTVYVEIYSSYPPKWRMHVKFRVWTYHSSLLYIDPYLLYMDQIKATIYYTPL